MASRLRNKIILVSHRANWLTMFGRISFLVNVKGAEGLLGWGHF